MAVDHPGSEPGLAGGEPLLSQLVRDHYRSLFAFAFRLTGSAADAEDLCQQTYLIVQTKIWQLRDPQKADRWLCRIARNCFLKARQRKQPLTGLELPVDEIPDRAERVDIDRERLQAALSALPADYRVVITMFYFEEYSYQQIASELEIPIGTVMSRLSRAKGKLRAALLQGEARPAPQFEAEAVFKDPK